MRNGVDRRICIIGILAMVAAVVLLAGCGGTTTATEAAGTSTPAAAQSSVTTEETKAYTIGISNPAAQNIAGAAWGDGVKETAEQLGWKAIEVDANLSVEKQIADLDQLVARKVDAIAVFAMDPKALSPGIERARKAGIVVTGLGFNFDETATQEIPLDFELINGQKFAGEGAAKLISEIKGPGAKVVGIGIAMPVPSDVLMMQRFHDQCDQLGLNWLEQQDNPSDDPAGAYPLMQNMLEKHPDAEAIFAYNDPSAIGASQAVLASRKELYDGKNDGVLVIGNNSAPDGIEALKAGKIWATFYDAPIEMGMVQAVAAIKLATGEIKSGDLQKQLVMPRPLVTLANLETAYTPWDQTLARMREPGGLEKMLQKDYLPDVLRQIRQ